MGKLTFPFIVILIVVIIDLFGSNYQLEGLGIVTNVYKRGTFGNSSKIKVYEISSNMISNLLYNYYIECRYHNAVTNSWHKITRLISSSDLEKFRRYTKIVVYSKYSIFGFPYYKDEVSLQSSWEDKIGY